MEFSPFLGYVKWPVQGLQAYFQPAMLGRVENREGEERSGIRNYWMKNDVNCLVRRCRGGKENKIEKYYSGVHTF